MVQSALFPVEKLSMPTSDSIIVLRGATWADYQRILELRDERSLPRVAYLEGQLELMSPSLSHEVIKSMISRLVETWCLEKGVEITAYGSWTQNSQESQRGVEPDECYVLGDNPEPSCCDLAIEVVWTSGGLDKLALYRKLGVRELWVWKDGELTLFKLTGDQHEPILASQALPGIDLEQLLGFVDIRPMTRAVRDYRAALATHRR
ncbi:Uma2 family endonuclease [Myxococcota bacterium]